MKSFFLKSILALVACFGLAAAASAQTTQETPESVAKAYFAAMQSGDWAKCASLMHPDYLGSVKRLLSTIIIADESGKWAKKVFGLKSNSDFAQLSEDAVFIRLMRFYTRDEPDMKNSFLAGYINKILGRVDERPDLVHIIYRSQIKLTGAEWSVVRLISLNKDGMKWRVLETREIHDAISQATKMIASEIKI